MQFLFQKRRGSGHVQSAESKSNGKDKKMKISQMNCMGILTGLSVIDIKCRKIPIGILAAADAGALIYQALFRKEDAALVFGGIAVGILMLAISRLTEESIGYGDSLGIAGLGGYLGFWKLLEVLAAAFFLLAVCGILVLTKKRMERKSALPFYPFLAVSYILYQLGGVYV